MTDRGPSIHTFTGRTYYPLDPRPADVDVEDIVASLGFLSRWTGHLREWYSVAQHSMLVADRVALAGGTPLDVLWALAHDASEAYTNDLARPLKESPELAGFRAIEHRNMLAICDRFRLPDRMPDIVREADDRMLATERRDLVVGTPSWTTRAPPYEDLTLLVGVLSPRESRDMFRARFLDQLRACGR